MIKMSYDQLSNNHFQQSVQKLASLPMNNVEAFRVKHIIQGLQKELEQMGVKFQKEVLDKYAKGGKFGVEMANEHNLPFTPIEGMEAQAVAAYKAFGKQEFTVPFKKIAPEFLFSFSAWTAAELIALEQIVAEPAQGLQAVPAENVG